MQPANCNLLVAGLAIPSRRKTLLLTSRRNVMRWNNHWINVCFFSLGTLWHQSDRSFAHLDTFNRIIFIYFMWSNIQRYRNASGASSNPFSLTLWIKFQKDNWCRYTPGSWHWHRFARMTAVYRLQSVCCNYSLPDWLEVVRVWKLKSQSMSSGGLITLTASCHLGRRT